MKPIHAFTIALALFTSCRENQRGKTLTEKEKTEQSKARSASPVDSILDGRAARLAGMDLSRLDDDDRRLATGIGSEWNRFRGEILDSVSEWSTKLRSEAEWSGDYAVFYPFSGPDIPFAMAMYPDARMYILVGLEKAGSPGSVLFTPSPTYSEFLRNAPRYFQFSSKYGFFRTNDMERQFAEKGVTDILAFYLKKMGCGIVSASLGKWDPQKGVVVEGNGVVGPDVCRIRFRKPDGKDANVVYFSKDLSDEALSRDPKWRPAVVDMLKGHYASMAKSASYLMHRSTFGTVRSMVLDSSGLHIQDDSGVSFAYISGSGRPYRLYGRYRRTIALFTNRFEPALREAYEREAYADLPFRIGYNAVYGESNLQVLLPFKK